MPEVILSEEQARVVGEAFGPVVVRDPKGNVIGHLEPKLTPEQIAELKRRAESPGPWYTGEQGTQTTSLCGRNAVQVAHRAPSRLNFEEMARHLGEHGAVSFNRFLLKFTAEGHEFTVFPDGRAIIKGTNDIPKARTLYAQFVGS